AARVRLAPSGGRRHGGGAPRRRGLPGRRSARSQLLGRARRRTARGRHRTTDPSRDRRLRRGLRQGGAMMVDDLVPAPPAGGRAASAPLLGRDTEPTLFELSEPGRRAWQLRTTGVPDVALDELVPAVHRRANPVALAEVSERDLVGHFTRLSHRQFSVDLGAYPLGSCTMKYNPKICDAVAVLPGLADVHPAAPTNCIQ